MKVVPPHTKEYEEAKPVKLLLIDDYTLFRQALAQLLTFEEDFEVVGETTNGEGAIKIALEKKPDIILMRLQTSLEGTKKQLARMRQISPPPKVIIHTTLEDQYYMRELMKLGVSAYLVKSAFVEHLLLAIRVVALDPNGDNAVIVAPRQMLEEAEGRSKNSLSAREREVLILAACGLSNRQIAYSLRLSEETVKRHLATIYNKMGAASRGAAVGLPPVRRTL